MMSWPFDLPSDPREYLPEPAELSALGPWLSDQLGTTGMVLCASSICALSAASTYRVRHRRERRLTGREAHVGSIERWPPPRGTRAHEANPSMPAVTLRKVPKPYKTISSTEKLWWVAGRDYDEPQMAAIAMTGAGKNQTLLDPTCWNILEHREESVVVMDVKGDMLEKFAYRTTAPRQYAYSFLVDHACSSAINLIETPEMAATTAAAIYPVDGVKVPAFNQGARRLFKALAAALGHSEGNMVELFWLLSDEKRLFELADQDERVARALSGKNEKFISDVTTSALLPLAPLERPEVARVFSPSPDTPQPHFLEKEVAWVCIPQNGGDVALLAGAIIDNLYDRAVACRRGTYFLIDEAGSCLTIKSLAKYLAMGRGLDAYFFLVLQDVSQLQDRIGAASTRSVLGSAGVQFWGASQDPETARYASGLSGMVRVRWGVYEHEGLDRTLRQAFSARGAPYEIREENRAGLLPEHVHGLPKGWWYAYDGDPHGVTLLIPAPMHAWPEGTLHCPEPRPILGIPPTTPTRPSPDEGPASARPAQQPVLVPEQRQAEEDAPDRNPEEEKSPTDDVACPGDCGKTVFAADRFCANCGCRL